MAQRYELAVSGAQYTSTYHGVLRVGRLRRIITTCIREHAVSADTVRRL
jgi:hypothetical protein